MNKRIYIKVGDILKLTGGIVRTGKTLWFLHPVAAQFPILELLPYKCTCKSVKEAKRIQKSILKANRDIIMAVKGELTK